MTRKQQLIPISILMGVVILALALLTAVDAAAQEPATITADRETMTVGDPIMLTVSINHPAGTVVLFPELDPNWGDFAVRRQGAPETMLNEDGSATSSQQIDVRLFAPGDFQTPPLVIALTDQNGNLSETTASPITLAVTSVLIEGDTELRDLKPQASLPTPALWPWLVSGLLAGLAGLAFVFWRRRRQREMVDNRLPHEKALAGLAALDKQQFPAHGRFKEQYSGVSDILRTYYEAITEWPMTDRTTAEIHQNLGAGPLNHSEAQRLLMIMEDCDMVKFAKVQPSRLEAERLIQNARQLVLDTKPVPASTESDNQAGPKEKQQGRQKPKQVEVAA